MYVLGVAQSELYGLLASVVHEQRKFDLERDLILRVAHNS